MNVLLLSTSHNELSQRAYNELVERGHVVTIKPVNSVTAVEEALADLQPELIIAAFLKVTIPDHITQKYTVLNVRPANGTDRGSSSLNGSIADTWQSWRITVVQAAGEHGPGGVWASQVFSMRQEGKGGYYRHHAAQAAVNSILEAVEKLKSQTFMPKPLHGNRAALRGRLHSVAH